MNEAIGETNRRRAKQMEYNKENNITPQSIIKGVDMELAHIVEADYVTVPLDGDALDAAAASIKTEEQLAEVLAQLENQMREAAKKFEFEKGGAVARPHSVTEAAGSCRIVWERVFGSAARQHLKHISGGLDQAAAKFVERIEGIAPDDATLAQRDDRRAQEHIREDHGSKRQRHAIEWRNAHHDVHAEMEAHGDQHGDRRKRTHPAVTEE